MRYEGSMFPDPWNYLALINNHFAWLMLVIFTVWYREDPRLDRVLKWDEVWCSDLHFSGFWIDVFNWMHFWMWESWPSMKQLSSTNLLSFLSISDCPKAYCLSLFGMQYGQPGDGENLLYAFIQHIIEYWVYPILSWIRKSAMLFGLIKGDNLKVPTITSWLAKDD